VFYITNLNTLERSPSITEGRYSRKSGYLTYAVSREPTVGSLVGSLAVS